MNIEVIITAIIGVCTTAASSLVTWLFSKRKYNAEVDNNVISNLQQSVETYKIIVNDLNERLNFYIKLAEDNKTEMFKVKNVLYSVINKSCTDASCTKRKLYSDEELKHLMGYLKPIENEPNFKKIESDS